MAKTQTEKQKSLEEAGGAELLRALGKKILGGAKGQYRRATSEARKLIRATRARSYPSLFPQVGFIVTNLSWQCKRVVRYNRSCFGILQLTPNGRPSKSSTPSRTRKRRVCSFASATASTATTITIPAHICRWIATRRRLTGVSARPMSWIVWMSSKPHQLGGTLTLARLRKEETSGLAVSSSLTGVPMLRILWLYGPRGPTPLGELVFKSPARPCWHGVFNPALATANHEER